MLGRGSVVILVGIACLAVGCVEVTNANQSADKPGSKETHATAWAKRMARSYDSREEIDRWAARGKDTEAGLAAVTDWAAALKDRASEKPTTIEIVKFVGRYDPIWKDDKYQRERSKQLTERIAQLPNETIKDWKKALDGVQKDGVSEIWTIAHMVSIDRMFSDDGFKPDESKVLLFRLRTLPDDTVEAARKAMNVGRAKAAITIAEEDAFFETDQLDKKTVDLALKQLQELVQKK